MEKAGFAPRDLGAVLSPNIIQHPWGVSNSIRALRRRVVRLGSAQAAHRVATAHYDLCFLQEMFDVKSDRRSRYQAELRHHGITPADRGDIIEDLSKAQFFGATLQRGTRIRDGNEVFADLILTPHCPDMVEEVVQEEVGFDPDNTLARNVKFAYGQVCYNCLVLRTKSASSRLNRGVSSRKGACPVSGYQDAFPIRHVLRM